jgi:hypothetical protein
MDQWFSALHVGAITATAWILLINAIVGYQLMDDGTPLSVALTLVSALTVFVAVTYVGVDTGFGYSGTFPEDDLRNYALYTLYLLFPLLLIVAFFILESVLVLGVLQETRPLGKFRSTWGREGAGLISGSAAVNLRAVFHCQPDLHFRHQRPYLRRYQRKNRWCSVRERVFADGSRRIVVLLELYH